MYKNRLRFGRFKLLPPKSDLGTWGSYSNKNDYQLNGNASNVFDNRNNVITLIRFYRGHECLWNPRNEDFYNVNMKNTIWNWIANQFGKSVTREEVQDLIDILQAEALKERIASKTCSKSFSHFGSEFKYNDEFDFLKVIEDIELDKESNSSSIHWDIGIKNNDNNTSPTSNRELCHITQLKKLKNFKKINSTYKIDILCDEIRNMLSSLPSNVSKQVQREIFRIMQNARVKTDDKYRRCSNLFK